MAKTVTERQTNTNRERYTTEIHKYKAQKFETQQMLILYIYNYSELLILLVSVRRLDVKAFESISLIF